MQFFANKRIQLNNIRRHIRQIHVTHNDNDFFIFLWCIVLIRIFVIFWSIQVDDENVSLDFRSFCVKLLFKRFLYLLYSKWDITFMNLRQYINLSIPKKKQIMSYKPPTV